MANREDIPVGRQFSVSRETLGRLWGCSEREVRRMISELRTHPASDGFAILSSSSNGQQGYWRSRDESEIQAFIRETENRSKNTLRALADAKRALREGASHG